MMIPTQIQDNIVRIDTPAVFAYYLVQKSLHYPLALVCDDEDKLVGVIGKAEIASLNLNKYNCGEICIKNYIYLNDANEDEIYSEARKHFAEKHILTLPIVDDSGKPIRLFARFQAFFLEQHGSVIHKPHYARALLQAAHLAKSIGRTHISAIEFGVASGNGLVSMEIYAREVQKLTGVNIDVYGFDAGKGLFPPADYRDCPNSWVSGDYEADMDEVSKRLFYAKLIVGDICQTTKTFLCDYNPHPIGFISVDVDQYHPTVAILNMLFADNKYFLPTFPIFFDDIFDNLEFQGETLAVREFNEQSKTIKIAPEHTAFDEMYRYWDTDKLAKFYPDRYEKFSMARMKWCHRFDHPDFSSYRSSKHIL